MSPALVMGSARDAVERVSGERWVIGGVAAELARRLDANVGVLRMLLVLAVWAEPAVLVVYAAAALLLPRGDRSLPSWSGLVALGRIGLAFAVVAGITPGLSGDVGFKVGPALWLPLGGVVVAGVLLLVASGPDAGEIDEARCREQVIGALPVLAIAAALIAGMAFVPQVRWERVAAVAVAAAGALAIFGRASVLLAAMLAAVVVLFAGANARFDGGIGATRLLPDHGGELTVRRAAGHVVVDLRNVRSGSVTLHASVGAGTLEIVLSTEAEVTSRLRVGRGRIAAGMKDGEGVKIERAPSGPSGARRRVPVTIVADVGIGNLRVRRVDGYNGRGDI